MGIPRYHDWCRYSDYLAIVPQSASSPTTHLVLLEHGTWCQGASLFQEVGEVALQMPSDLYYTKRRVYCHKPTEHLVFSSELVKLLKLYQSVVFTLRKKPGLWHIFISTSPPVCRIVGQHQHNLSTTNATIQLGISVLNKQSLDASRA